MMIWEGFYRSKYQNKDDYMVVTQFEATDPEESISLY